MKNNWPGDVLKNNWMGLVMPLAEKLAGSQGIGWRTPDVLKKTGKSLVVKLAGRPAAHGPEASYFSGLLTVLQIALW